MATPDAGAHAEESAERERRAFPPPDFTPPHERSAQPGDGRWVPLGDAAAGDRAAEGPPVLMRTVVHPHPSSRFLSLTVAAADLSRVRPVLVAGTQDPEAPHVPKSAKTGLIKPEHLPRALAVFNGGFQERHGRWGVMMDGQQFVKPREDGCTVALEGRTLRIASFPRLADSVAALTFYRQTPPCLVEDGALHPSLLRGNDRPWGGKKADLVTRRRSAIGVDASGSVLFFGVGQELSAKQLAEAMQAAGAVAAAELDINWYWTRFLLIGTPPDGSGPAVTSTLLDGMEHARGEYLTRPSQRDFFYLYRDADAAPP